MRSKAAIFSHVQFRLHWSCRHNADSNLISANFCKNDQINLGYGQNFIQIYVPLAAQNSLPCSNNLHVPTPSFTPTFIAIASCSTIFDNLRQLKSQIEGTYFKFEPIQLDSDKLVHLKHLTVAYTPSTLQEQTKAKMAEKLAELFQGQVKKLLFACILTCPWFAQAQSEVSAQAKNNLLYVVFVASDEQFFSLATPHERELCETLDEARSLSSMHKNSLQVTPETKMTAIWFSLSFSLLRPLPLLFRVFSLQQRFDTFVPSCRGAMFTLWRSSVPLPRA